MPPLAGLALGFLATDLGIAGAITDAIVGAGILDGTAAVVAGFALTGAAVGATSAAITGGDIGQGALFGGLSAGITGGIETEFPNIGGLPTDASNALTSTGVTTGLRLAQGQSLGKAAEAGLISGAGSYAGSQVQDFLKSQFPSPNPSAPTPGQSTPSGPASPPPSTSQSPQAPGGGADPGVETVVASANAPASPDISGAGNVEIVHVTGQRQSPSQSDLNLSQALNFGGNLLAKTGIGAAQYGLDAALGGNSVYQRGVAPATAPGGGTAPGSTTASPGSAAGAATAQAGQAGSSSVYAPGSPIFGDDGSATKPGVWNTASLRTPQAEGA